MHINMKYYIVTIGAIFLALGIGMLVGFNLNYDQELSKQQENIISDLDSKFEDLKTTNDNLEENLLKLSTEYDNTIDYINKNSDKLITDALTEKNVGIISVNENNEYNNEIQDTLSKSNATIAFNIVLTNNIDNKEKLDEVATKLNIELKNKEDLVKYIASCLEDEGGANKLQELQTLELIKLNNISNEYINCDSIVLTGGSEVEEEQNKYNKTYEDLIVSLKEQNKNIIGVQKSNAKFSDVDLYSKNKINSIDNIDEGIGQVSLVILLNEKGISGNFGRLDSAERLLPYKK